MATEPGWDIREYDLLAIRRFLNGEEVDSLTVKRDKASPWISFDVWIHLRGEFKFAMWRTTKAIHLVGIDSAVSDDPIEKVPEGLSPLVQHEQKMRKIVDDGMEEWRQALRGGRP